LKTKEMFVGGLKVSYQDLELDAKF
jgi:hypothetical protein